LFLFPQKQEVIEIQEKLIDTFGGIHGLRDESALESALAAVENRLITRTLILLHAQLLILIISLKLMLSLMAISESLQQLQKFFLS
jgi:prophage maintenance system killer protein